MLFGCVSLSPVVAQYVICVNVKSSFMFHAGMMRFHTLFTERVSAPFACFLILNLSLPPHLLLYCTVSGAYYSYLFAKLYAAHIWSAHFAADPLNRCDSCFSKFAYTASVVITAAYETERVILFVVLLCATVTLLQGCGRLS